MKEYDLGLRLPSSHRVTTDRNVTQISEAHHSAILKVQLDPALKHRHRGSVSACILRGCPSQWWFYPTAEHAGKQGPQSLPAGRV